MNSQMQKKKQQIKPKANNKKIIKIRVEINKNETKRYITLMNRLKNKQNRYIIGPTNPKCGKRPKLIKSEMKK